MLLYLFQQRREGGDKGYQKHYNLKLNNMNLSELKVNKCYNHKTLGIVKLIDKENLCFIDTLGYYHLINLIELIN